MAPLPPRPAPGRVRALPLPGFSLLIAALVAALGLLALAGCGDDDTTAQITDQTTSVASSGEVRIELSESTVRPGESFTASIVNESEAEVTYGAGYTLEREVDGSFESFPIPAEPIPDIGLVAPPGKTGPAVDVRVPRRAAPGTYRVLLSTSVEGPQPSAEFTVRG